MSAHRRAAIFVLPGIHDYPCQVVLEFALTMGKTNNIRVSDFLLLQLETPPQDNLGRVPPTLLKRQTIPQLSWTRGPPSLRPVGFTQRYLDPRASQPPTSRIHPALPRLESLPASDQCSEKTRFFSSQAK